MTFINHPHLVSRLRLSRAIFLYFYSPSVSLWCVNAGKYTLTFLFNFFSYFSFLSFKKKGGGDTPRKRRFLLCRTISRILQNLSSISYILTRTYVIQCRKHKQLTVTMTDGGTYFFSPKQIQTRTTSHQSVAIRERS